MTAELFNIPNTDHYSRKNKQYITVLHTKNALRKFNKIS